MGMMAIEDVKNLLETMKECVSDKDVYHLALTGICSEIEEMKNRMDIHFGPGPTEK